MKKTVSIILLLTLLAGVLGGCGTSLKGDDKGAMISVYMLKYPVTLDPAVAQSDAEALQLFGLVYEGLTTINSKGEVKEGLATSWRGYQDRITQEYKMEFKLRDSRWSDQRETSADALLLETHTRSRIREPVRGASLSHKERQKMQIRRNDVRRPRACCGQR